MIRNSNLRDESREYAVWIFKPNDEESKASIRMEFRLHANSDLAAYWARKNALKFRWWSINKPEAIRCRSLPRARIYAGDSKKQPGRYLTLIHDASLDVEIMIEAFDAHGEAVAVARSHFDHIYPRPPVGWREVLFSEPKPGFFGLVRPESSISDQDVF